MKKLQANVLFFLFFPVHLLSINHLRTGDIRYLSMGGNGVTQTVLFNPALIALSESKCIQIQYYNKYGLKELGNIQGSFLFPNSFLPTAVQVISFGYDAYRESMFRLATGKKLNDHWTLGIGIQYSVLQTELFEERPSSLSTDLGITFLPVENVLVGISVINVPSISVGDQKADINDFTDYSVQLGVEWEVINNLLITGYLGTEEEQMLIGGIGIEYTAFDCFYLRSGIQSKPLTPSFGLGYDFSSFRIDAVVTWHEVLGISSGVGISFSF